MRYLINLFNCLCLLLIYWYSNQVMCQIWSGNLSENVGVTNGVRQGGILLPYRFNICVWVRACVRACMCMCVYGLF